MPDTTPHGQRPDTRQDAARMPTVPVAEAARRLGVTTDAVRRRLQRGTLAGEKIAGVWQVAASALPADTTPPGQPPGPRQDAPGQRPDTARTPETRADPTRDDLVEHLRAEVEYLRAELHAERERSATERERADVLMREALGRIEAITAGPVADAGEARQDTSQSTQDAPGEARADDVAPDTSEPWWRRWWRTLREG